MNKEGLISDYHINYIICLIHTVLPCGMHTRPHASNVHTRPHICHTTLNVGSHTWTNTVDVGPRSACSIVNIRSHVGSCMLDNGTCPTATRWGLGAGNVLSLQGLGDKGGDVAWERHIYS